MLNGPDMGAALIMSDYHGQPQNTGIIITIIAGKNG